MDIWNTALSHLGISKEVASVDESSAEAKACRRFYDTTIKAVLKDYSWPFASKIATLNLITANPMMSGPILTGIHQTVYFFVEFYLETEMTQS